MVIDHREDLYQKVYREFCCNCLEVDLGRDYKESKYFKGVLLSWIFGVCEINPTNTVAPMIHVILKSFLFKEPGHRRGIYKPI